MWYVYEVAVLSVCLSVSAPFEHFGQFTDLLRTVVRLHNEELHDLYCSPNIVRVIKSRRMRWAGHVARMGEEREVYRVLMGKPEGKRPLGRPRRRWVDNIRTDRQ